jgi:hypothetical protein
MNFDRVTVLHTIAGVGAALLVIALMCHNLARKHVDHTKLSRWSGAERQMRAFWVSAHVLKEEGHAPARIRNWAFGIAMVLLVGGGILQEYVWNR